MARVNYRHPEFAGPNSMRQSYLGNIDQIIDGK
jgi:hypothetical protein